MINKDNLLHTIGVYRAWSTKHLSHHEVTLMDAGYRLGRAQAFVALNQLEQAAKVLEKISVVFAPIKAGR